MPIKQQCTIRGLFQFHHQSVFICVVKNRYKTEQGADKGLHIIAHGIHIITLQLYNRTSQIKTTVTMSVTILRMMYRTTRRLYFPTDQAGLIYVREVLAGATFSHSTATLILFVAEL